MGVASYSPCGAKKWICLCKCGSVTVKNTSNILRAKAKETGCAKCGRNKCDEARKTHGLHGHPVYKTWCRIRARCYTKTASNYKWYGGKGIKLCDEWQNFKNFFVWAFENGYEEGLSIDRIDPNDDYSPNNCRWVTKSENSRCARIYHGRS